VKSPGDGHCDFIPPHTNARTGDDGLIGHGNALFYEQECVRRAHVGTVESAVHAQRLAQATRAAGKLLIRATTALRTHGLDSFQWFHGPDEHRCWTAFLLGDDVETMVHPIDQVDV
jgi:hypothetical protein